MQSLGCGCQLQWLLLQLSASSLSQHPSTCLWTCDLLHSLPETPSCKVYGRGQLSFLTQLLVGGAGPTICVLGDLGLSCKANEGQSLVREAQDTSGPCLCQSPCCSCCPSASLYLVQCFVSDHLTHPLTC